MREHIKTAHALGKRAASSKSFKRYLFVGLSTVLIDYVVLITLRKVFAGGLVYSVSIAYWISIAYNFLLNRYWSFEAGAGLLPRQLILYFCLLFFNYIFTVLVISGFKAMDISEYIAKFFVLVMAIPWTYYFYKKIVFSVK